MLWAWLFIIAGIVGLCIAVPPFGTGLAGAAVVWLAVSLIACTRRGTPPRAGHALVVDADSLGEVRMTGFASAEVAGYPLPFVAAGDGMPQAGPRGWGTYYAREGGGWDFWPSG